VNHAATQIHSVTDNHTAKQNCRAYGVVRKGIPGHKSSIGKPEQMALQARILDPEIFEKLFSDSSASSDSTGP